MANRILIEQIKSTPSRYDSIRKYIARIDPQYLSGPWNGGWALDLHTLLCKRTNSGFENLYSSVGKLLNHIKYHNGSLSEAHELAKYCFAFLIDLKVTPFLDGIIYIPPTDLTRIFQPVEVIGNHISKWLSVPNYSHLIAKTKMDHQLKENMTVFKKEDLLRQHITVSNGPKLKKLLLFDDIYQTGATLSIICNKIREKNIAEKIYVLTITKTRSKKYSTPKLLRQDS